MGKTGSIEESDTLGLSKFIGKQEVAITGSMLSEIPSNFLRYLSSCTDLNLSNNSFSTIPPELQQLQHLHSLNLSGNIIKKLRNIRQYPIIKRVNTKFMLFKRITRNSKINNKIISKRKFSK